MTKSLKTALAEQQLPADRLKQLRGMAAAARDTELEIADLTARLAEANARFNALLTSTLPALFEELGVPSITLAAEGNAPSYELTLKPYYSANIPTSWDADRRAAAFKWLEDNGHGDLIKTVVEAAFPREERTAAKAAAALLEAQGVRPSIKETVHGATLSAWLRAEIEENSNMPPLDVIGGKVGKVVKIKQRRD